jgi:methionyl-tRNA formyltransferase
MRILYLGNNRVGWKILSWLKNQGEEIVGLVVHPPSKQKFASEIIDTAGLSEAHIFDGSQLRNPKVISKISDLQADIGLSILFGFILKEEFIRIPKHGIINLHPAYLPFNRGQYPNVWSIVEKTPAGISLHYIDKGIDTGKIIARNMVAIEPIDTGETLYHKLEQESIDLFKNTWPRIRTGRIPYISPEDTIGTYHRTKDTETIDHIDLNRMYRAEDLINIIRARTYPPYHGAYFIEGDRKVYMRLQLYYDKD